MRPKDEAAGVATYSIRPEPSLRRKLLVPGVMLAVFWSLAIALWLKTGLIFPLVNFGYIGTSVALGMALYALLPRKSKSVGRKLALFLVGVYMLGFLGLLGQENMQVEGFFLYVLSGFVAGAVIHYLVAKIVGPIIFGRAWCGWACWTAMLLDLFPFSRSPGRVPGKWGLMRYAHFGLSLLLVLGLWFGLDYRVDITHRSRDLSWLLAGNLIYYLSGISLAFALKDNRAFCKYLCPITALLKLTSRCSLLKVGADAAACNACGACMKACPMDIRVMEYVQSGRRVASTECITCQSCINACPRRVLSLAFGLDIGGKECLSTRGIAGQDVS